MTVKQNGGYKYVQISYILPVYILCRAHFFNGCEVNSNVVSTRTVRDFGHTIYVGIKGYFMHF